MLSQLPVVQREPIGDFLIAYMKQTHKILLPLTTFIPNIIKAYNEKKFGLQSLVKYGLIVGFISSSKKSFTLATEEEITSTDLKDVIKPKFEAQNKGSK